jgi:hypothetical protein
MILKESFDIGRTVVFPSGGEGICLSCYITYIDNYQPGGYWEQVYLIEDEKGWRSLAKEDEFHFSPSIVEDRELYFKKQSIITQSDLDN